MKYLICALALSFGVAYGDIPANLLNQTHDGATINAGTYLNTHGAETVFKNSAGTGITLNAGSNIRGAEVLNGAVTGNGGNIHIQAPDQVVRLNGNIDVRGFLPKNAPPIPGYLYPGESFLGEWHNPGPGGNGGNVTIDAAYLFQNGNIYAGGYNGGNVQFNVGGMAMGSTSRIDATSGAWSWSPGDDPSQIYTSYGNGGSVKINSTGEVNIPKGAFITTTGLPNFDSSNPSNFNNIYIEGGTVNMEGILHAGSVQYRGGSISLIANAPDGDVNIGKDAILQASGGTIDISSQRDINQNGRLLNNGGTSAVPVEAYLSAGSIGQAGGQINLKAERSINNTGRIQADGGSSAAIYNGSLSILDRSTIPYRLIMPPGYAGADGGSISLSANTIQNTGVIRSLGGEATHPDSGPQVIYVTAPGGNGGAISFSANPTGNGIVAALQGTGGSASDLVPYKLTPGKMGTIKAPDPASSTNTLIGVWKKN